MLKYPRFLCYVWAAVDLAKVFRTEPGGRGAFGRLREHMRSFLSKGLSRLSVSLHTFPYL